MSIDMLIMVGTLIAVLILLVLELLSADVALLIGLALVIVTGVIPLEEGLQGFASPTLLALGSLYVISAALQKTGALTLAGRYLFGRVKKIRLLILRMVIPVSVGSAFLNNTPIVAMGIPAIQTWCEENRISASKLLMPLSFASIFGGMCTLMGTSTNLVAHGLLRSHGMEGLGFFELAAIGIPCTIVGWIYLVFVSPSLLPERDTVHRDDRSTGDHIPHDKMVRLDVVDETPGGEATIDSAALHELTGFHLDHLEREGEVISPVPGNARVRGGDRLYYVPTGQHGAYVPDATPHEGVRLSVPRVEDLARTDPGRESHTVVVGEGSGLAGERLGDTEFLRRFDAVISEVRRGGKSVEGPLRDIVLRPGDTLVLDTGLGFRTAFESSPEFYVTSSYEEGEQEEAAAQAPRARLQMWATLGILLGIVVTVVSGALHIAAAALVGAILVIVGKVINANAAREAIDWNVLLVVGASLGLGQAMDTSGTADLIARGIIAAATDLGAFGLLAAIVLGTSVLTNVITNNGAVALFFPIALSVASAGDLDPRPLVIGLTVAGSMAMVTPLGYQTNLMVYSAGDYRFLDFAKVGTPLQIVLMIVAVGLIPFVWSF